MNESTAHAAEAAGEGAAANTVRTKVILAKTLPTERIASEKQLAVLRAYAAASGSDRKAVTNDEVAAVHSDVAPSSVSLCNPFFSDVGLLISEGRKQRPSDAVFDYLHAYEWSPETASLKLGRILGETWAAKVLTTRLAFRVLSKEEAIGVLAEESKATKAHKRNLDILIDFLCASGVIKIEGGTVMKGVPPNQQSVPPTAPLSSLVEAVTPPAASPRNNDPDTEQFTIPIPLKGSATIMFPKDIDAADWQMVIDMTAAYMRRLKGFEAKP